MRIDVKDVDGDGKFEGCAKIDFLTNFGFLVDEGGTFAQIEDFKVFAEVDASGTVIFYEWTEVARLRTLPSVATEFVGKKGGLV